MRAMSPVRSAHAAHLRIYEPLAAFEGAERRSWEAYVAAGSAPGREQGLRLEQEASLRALVGRSPSGLPDLAEHAFVTVLDGVTLVCPWRTRVRAAEALVEFTSELPDEIADAYLPRGVAESALDELEEWRLAHPHTRLHVLTSAWQVPVRWFVLVEPDEREVRTGGGPAGGPMQGLGRALVYRTPMSRARRRVARALAVLRRAVEESDTVDLVEDLGRWLEDFHPRSLVELDYGGLVHLASDEDLAADESSRDVAEALVALSAGRAQDAAQAYGRVQARMKALQAVEGAN